MTRDHKLAVVLGFAVVLAVGVLLSDHVSAARRATLDDVSAGAELGFDANGGRALGGPLPALASTTPPVRTPPAPAETGRTRPLQPVLVGPTVVRNEPEPGPVIIDPLRGLFPQDQTRGELRGRARDGARDRAADRDNETPPREISEPAPPAAPTTYRVARGDTLYSIARDLLGDAGRWREIAEANRGRIPRSNRVLAGVELRIPGGGLPSPDTPAEARAEPEPATRPAPEPRPYVVKPGETLSGIAQRELGSVRRQGDIIALNAGRLDDPDDIRAGMRLLLPSG